jgi:hypothetical protein
VIVVAHAGVDELDHHFLPDPLDIAIAPGFKWKRGGFAATFFHGALVTAAGGMGIDFIGWSEHDVHVAAVALPAGDAGREVLVGIGDTPIVLFLVFVLFGVGCGIATLPEGLNELVALFIVGELHEGGSFFVGDDPAHVLIQPLPVRLAQLDLERLGVLLSLRFRNRTLERIRLCLRPRAFVIGTIRCFILSRRNGGETQCHQSQHSHRATISKTCGEHRKAYLTRNARYFILCSLDTTWQEGVA